MPKLYITTGEPGFVRISTLPHYPGIRYSIHALIMGMANRGKHHVHS